MSGCQLSGHGSREIGCSPAHRSSTSSLRRFAASRLTSTTLCTAQRPSLFVLISLPACTSAPLPARSVALPPPHARLRRTTITCRSSPIVTSPVLCAALCAGNRSTRPSTALPPSVASTTRCCSVVAARVLLPASRPCAAARRRAFKRQRRSMCTQRHSRSAARGEAELVHLASANSCRIAPRSRARAAVASSFVHAPTFSHSVMRRSDTIAASCSPRSSAARAGPP